MKNKIKTFLFKIGIYDYARNIIKKVYYPYKNYRIRSKAEIILKKLNNIFEKYTEDYWLDYGTLLGYVREGKIIKGDLDLDFGVIADKSLSNYLEKEEIYLMQQLEVEGILTAEQYRYKDIGFDIFYYRLEDNKLKTNVWLALDYSIPQKVVYEQGKGELGETTFSNFKTKEIIFYNIPFKIPKDSTLYLKEHYGEDFMIPNPNFSQKDEKNRNKVNKQFKVIFYDDLSIIKRK